MQKTVTFLQLSEEFGGTRFGPFEGVEIRLGSDPSLNDITLPEALGVAPEHVKVLKQQDDSFIIAPVERTATVYCWRARGGKPKQVMAPMAVASGDGFSLVTPEGPRFYLLAEKDRHAIEEAAQESEGPGLGINRPSVSAGGIIGEIKRRGFAKVFATRLGNMWMTAWRMIKTGQIFSPVYIVGGMLILSGWLFAGGAGCSALSMSRKKNDAREQLTNCKDQLGVGDDEGLDPTVPGLTQKILIDREWRSSIDADKALYEAYAKALVIIFADPERYKWVYTKSGGEFAKFKRALEGTGMPDDLVRVLAYSSAQARAGGAREWSIVEDSESAEVCGRGPLELTFRQGYRLGLSNLQLDALVERTLAESNDVGRQREELEATNASIDAGLDKFLDDEVLSAGAALQGGMECIYIDGDDDRSDPKKVAQALQRHIGASKSKGLPREQEAYWIASRVVRLYAMDFRRGFEELDFNARNAPSTVMDLAQVKGSRKNYAIKKAAMVIARAVAVPCLATLDKEIQNAPPAFMGDLPNLGNCAIVKAFVEYDRL